MATVTESSLSTIKKKTERGERGFPGPAGPVTGGVYPAAGIPLSTGVAWGMSIVNNSANWNTAYEWGDHSIAGYASAVDPEFTGTATFAGGEIEIGEEDVTSAYLRSPESMYFNIDSNDNETGKHFTWGTNREKDTGGTSLMKLQDDGDLYLYGGDLILGVDSVSSAYIKSPESIYFNCDSDNTGTGNKFVWGTNRSQDTGGTALMELIDSGILQNPSFNAGWQGSNWQIQADGDAEFNNVLIRGGLSVYELIINQLHYQNGGLIIGAGAGKIDTIVSGTAGSEVLTFHDPEGNDMVPFSAGAIVMCQRVDINRTDVVKKIVRRVASISGMEVTLATTTGWTTGDDTGVFETGDEVCAIGHLTNDSLDSCIYMSATDADNPFLRVLDGVNSYSKFSLGDKTTVKLQIGNLLSLASYDFLPSSPGYGLYCDNAYLNGRIVLPNAGMTNEGSSDSDIRIYAGSAYDDMATAPFRVTQNGSLTATGIAELGTATATVDGKASNVAIRGCDIWENAYNGDNSSLLINRIGYNGGTTKYRDFAVYNGKGSKLITVGGGTMNYVSFGNINYDDLEISLYGTCQNVWAKQLIYAYGGVSNNVLISWDTPASTTNTSYTKLKTFTLGAYLKPNRTLRLKFDLKATSNTSYATIYRNGSPVGTERITSSVSYVTYSEDISGWNPSDAIELYVKSSDAGNTASVQNFRICGDMVTSIATELQATAS